MSNHMSAKAMETFSIQRERSRLKRRERSVSRVDAFIERREANRRIGLQTKASLRFQHNCSSVFGFFCFLYIQAMTLVYFGWYTFDVPWGF